MQLKIAPRYKQTRQDFTAQFFRSDLYFYIATGSVPSAHPKNEKFFGCARGVYNSIFVCSLVCITNDRSRIPVTSRVGGPVEDGMWNTFNEWTC